METPGQLAEAPPSATGREVEWGRGPEKLGDWPWATQKGALFRVPPKPELTEGLGLCNQEFHPIPFPTCHHPRGLAQASLTTEPWPRPPVGVLGSPQAMQPWPPAPQWTRCVIC